MYLIADSIVGAYSRFPQNFAETPPDGLGSIPQKQNMPTGRRPEHAPSSAAGQGLFLNWRTILRR
jgi:hypothetical protein